MGPNWKAYDREEEAIIEAFNRGDISREQYAREMRELQRGLREDYEDDRDRMQRDLDNQWGRDFG